MSARVRLWLLDAHYQIFRAYHAMPDLRAPDGRPVRNEADRVPRFQD